MPQALLKTVRLTYRRSQKGSSTVLIYSLNSTQAFKLRRENQTCVVASRKYNYRVIQRLGMALVGWFPRWNILYILYA